MTRRRFVHSMLCLGGIGVGIAIAVAAGDHALVQSTSITGYVTDSSGTQPIPGASVTAMPETGGSSRRTTSDANGAYQLEAMPDGTYRVDFECLGFNIARRNRVRVRSGGIAEVNATLFLSSVCECVSYPLPSTALQERAGQVVTESGSPLPHARLLVVVPARREVAFADDSG